jgi:hypothetical protein
MPHSQKDKTRSHLFFPYSPLTLRRGRVPNTPCTHVPIVPTLPQARIASNENERQMSYLHADANVPQLSPCSYLLSLSSKCNFSLGHCTLDQLPSLVNRYKVNPPARIKRGYGGLRPRTSYCTRYRYILNILT